MILVLQDTLRQSSPGHINMGHPNRGAVVPRCLSLVECGCDTGEQGSPVVSSEHAREYAHSIGPEFFKDVPTFGHPDQPAILSIGHPDGSFRIETDSIRRNVRLAKTLSTPVRCRRIAEGCPCPSLAQSPGG